MWFLLILMCSVLFLFQYLRRNDDYWKFRGIAGPKPTLLFGNFSDYFLSRVSFPENAKKYYFMYPTEKYVGLFAGTRATIMTRDPEIAKTILVKDFNYFVDRGLSVGNDPLGENLFNTTQDTWKVLRHNLGPVFSSGKIKKMYYLIEDCGRNFQNYVGEVIDRGEDPEMRSLMGRYSVEVICSCAFGIDLETLENGSNPFLQIAKRIFEPSAREIILRMVDSVIPGLIHLFGLYLSKPEVVTFFNTLVRQTVQEREGKPKVRQDFMDLILELREKGRVAGGKCLDQDKRELTLEITDKIMASQAFIFFAAGFETCSGLLSFTLYELALHPEIQERVRSEVAEVSKKYNGITYDSLQEMEYLDMVLSETLRKYPVGELLTRECVQEYQLPETGITIDKGTRVIIPANAWYRDPNYFPNPDKFDPERFSPKKRDNRLPYVPFGVGPRYCIGQRFAKVQSMLGMSLFLQKYGVEPSPKTEPAIKFHNNAITLTSANGVWLKLYRI